MRAHLKRILAVLLLGLVTGGCETAPAVEGADVLWAGTSPTAPPLIFREDGRLTGLEADFAAALEQALGRPVRFRTMRFDQLIPALRSGKIDVIMAGMSITEDRRGVVAFTTPYVQVGQLAAVRADEASRFVSIRSIAHHAQSVACEHGTTAHQIAASRFPRARVATFGSLEAAADSVIHGRNDVLLGDGPSVVWQLRRHPGQLAIPDYSFLTDEALAWAVRPDDVGLLQQLNAVLATWRHDLTLMRTIDRWAGTEP